MGKKAYVATLNKMCQTYYDQGYQQGRHDAINEECEEIIRSDLMYVYGFMVLAMHQRGYKQSTIINFCNNIQKNWQEYTVRANQFGVHYKTFPEQIRDKTGIDLEQIFLVEEREDDNEDQGNEYLDEDS